MTERPNCSSSRRVGRRGGRVPRYGCFAGKGRAAPDENRGAFLALNSTILRQGQTLGPVLMAPLGLAGAYLCAGALAAAMFVVALALIR